MKKVLNLFKENPNRPTAKTNIIFIIIFVLLTFFDQWTKWLATHHLIKADIPLIPNVLELHYLENHGAAWGILQNQTWFLVTVPIIVLTVLIYEYFKLPAGKKYLLLRFSFVLLASGAIGNFIDRTINQYVVDFIYFSLIDFPVFNVADCYVCISSALILYCIIIKHKDEDLL